MNLLVHDTVFDWVDLSRFSTTTRARLGRTNENVRGSIAPPAPCWAVVPNVELRRKHPQTGTTIPNHELTQLRCAGGADRAPGRCGENNMLTRESIDNMERWQGTATTRNEA